MIISHYIGKNEKISILTMPFPHRLLSTALFNYMNIKVLYNKHSNFYHLKNLFIGSLNGRNWGLFPKGYLSFDIAEYGLRCRAGHSVINAMLFLVHPKHLGRFIEYNMRQIWRIFESPQSLNEWSKLSQDNINSQNVTTKRR